MKPLACLLLGLAALTTGAAGADSAATTTAPADATPAAPDDQTLATQLVYCAVITQKLGGKAKAGWSLSYSGAAAALTSTAFATMQMLAQSGAADSLSADDLQNASTQCQQTMVANSARIGTAMQSKQGGTAGQ